jgi:hypothetical protein
VFSRHLFRIPFIIFEIGALIGPQIMRLKITLNITGTQRSRPVVQAASRFSASTPA